MNCQPKINVEIYLDSLVFLLILARFNEWGQAVWNLQKKVLDGRSTGPSWYYLGFVVDNPDVEARDLVGQKLIATMNGKIMGDPYFKCDFFVVQSY